MHYLNRLFQPAGEHQATAWLFLKLLSLIYFVAFLSLFGEITGLVGTQGILPVEAMLENAANQLGHSAWLYFPTLFWFNASDMALLAATITGVLLSLTLLIGFQPRLSLIALFILYLSLAHAGQIFLNFQWDYLLLESGFLAIFLVNNPSRITILLFHWLLFRLRFLSGVSKLVSGDPSWSGLTALKHYFEAQPLPHTGAWFAHQLPEWLLQAGVLLTFFSELIVPFFIFLPRRFRIAAAVITILMQLLIIATSNHNFVNLLTIMLCLFLLDDRIVGKILPSHRLQGQVATATSSGWQHNTIPALAAALIIFSSVPRAVSLSTASSLPTDLNRAIRLVNRFGIGNTYHVFPVMPTERIELEIEGSDDGQNWQAYVFKWKPGPPDRRPAFIVPHQPRLDWMIWFVPAQRMQTSFWFDAFMQRLWEGAPQVTALLRVNPFIDKPPAFLRVMAYRYQFATWEEREQSGNWWQRELIGEFPQVPPRVP